MIDIHCHILHGIDDGSPDLETSLKMAEQAVQDGITHIVATPHFRPPYDYELQKVLRGERIQQLKDALKEKNIPLELLAGAEVQVQEFTFKELLANNPQLLVPGAESNERTALIELQLEMPVERAKDLFFLSQLYHTRMILAHPERYPKFLKSVDVLKSLLEQGIMLQFNVTSIRKGFFNRHMNRAILDLIAAAPEQVFLATDAHEPEMRPCKFTPAKEVVVKALGEDVWQQITLLNQKRLLGLE